MGTIRIALVACVLSAWLGAQRAPNVVLVLADDLGIGDLGCYNQNSKVPTPNLDRIAGTGMRFTDMHSPSAVCSPTRYALLTGRYAWRSRMKRGVLNGYSRALIERGRPTIASVLRAKGYATGAFGKWHLGLGDAKRTDYAKPLTPGTNDVGFDRFWGIPASLDMPPYVWVQDDRVVAPPTDKIAKSEHRRRLGGGFWRGGAIAPGFRHDRVLGTTTDKAVEWIAQQAKRRAAGEIPAFFCYVPLSAPHTPWLPSEQFRGKSKAGHYGDFVAMVDAAIGRIAQALDDADAEDDTLLIVTSDNGSHWPRGDIEKFGHRANLDYRGQKADIWEGGHRVPFLARWPVRIAGNSVSRQTACLTDVFATVAALTDVELPDAAAEDSFDLSSALFGKDRAPIREAVIHHSLSGVFAVRSGEWKLVLGRGSGGFTAPRRIPMAKRKPGDPRGQLYNLIQDRAEALNLWNERPDIVRRLTAILDRYRERGRSRPKGATAKVVNASGGVLRPDQAAFDVHHYDLGLRVDPDTRTIRGSLTVTARIVEATDRIVLQLDDRLDVLAARLGIRELPHSHERGLVTVGLPRAYKLGEMVAVTVVYGGKPRQAPRPPWDGGFTWKKTADGRPWIATSCQGEGADLWWPCKDHPSDKPDRMDLRITVPDGLVCASNGVLQSSNLGEDGMRTFHWRVHNPISNYCVALNIAPYEVLKREFVSVAGDKVPVSFYCLPESKAQAEKFLPEVLDHLRFFEDVCGPYPFRKEKYGVAETPHLGMEHQTIIAYGNKFRRQRFEYDWLHHHELAHEWWGNLVTCRDWKDMWIHEGFGTYMQALYIERKHGAAAYRVEMGVRRRQLSNRQPVAPRGTLSSKEVYFGGRNNDIYYKGSWILHTLRFLIGDEALFRSLRRMCYPTPESEKATDGSQVRLVDTEDYRKLCEKITGRELGWFFEVYLRQPKLPKLAQKREGNTLQLRWEAPAGLRFPMPVPVRINGKVQRVKMKGGKGQVTIPAGAAFEVDPDKWLLRSE